MRSILLPATRSPIPAATYVAAVMMLAGCGAGQSVAPFEQVTDPREQYMQLVLDHHAINLSTVAPYHTVQLTATPFDATGTAMTGLEAPVFRSTDTLKVKVSSAGLVTALQATPAAGVVVVADLVGPHNVRHTDSAFVKVVTTTDPPPALAALSIHPVPPDSSIIAMPSPSYSGLFFPWAHGFFPTPPSLASRTRALTADGNTIPGIIAEYVALDPAVADVSRATGELVRSAPGTARFVARTLAYGVDKVDTATFTITPPSGQIVVITDYWDGAYSMFGPTIYIRPYGMVVWVNKLQPVDVVFDDPAVTAAPPDAMCSQMGNGFFVVVPIPGICGVGNFSLTVLPANSFTHTSSDVQARWFVTPGTYDYHDGLTGATGRIVVTDGTS